MSFTVTPRSVTLDELELLYVRIFEEFRGISQISEATAAKRMKIDQYCQRQRCKHVELEQFLACFRAVRVCQRRLGFLVVVCVPKIIKFDRFIHLLQAKT